MILNFKAQHGEYIYSRIDDIFFPYNSLTPMSGDTSFETFSEMFDELILSSTNQEKRFFGKFT